MNSLSDLFAAALKIAGQLVSPKAAVVMAGKSVTALQLETAAGSLSAFFSAMAAAIKAKNFETGAEVAIEEAVRLAADLGLGEPITGIAASLLPSVFSALAQMGAQPLINANGTWVSQQWADDPRHQLNRNGTFKY